MEARRSQEEGGRSVFMSQGCVHDVSIKQMNVWSVFLRETHASSGVKDKYTTVHNFEVCEILLLLQEFSRLIIFIK